MDVDVTNPYLLSLVAYLAVSTSIWRAKGGDQCKSTTWNIKRKPQNKDVAKSVAAEMSTFLPKWPLKSRKNRIMPVSVRMCLWTYACFIPSLFHFFQTQPARCISSLRDAHSGCALSDVTKTALPSTCHSTTPLCHTWEDKKKTPKTHVPF